MTAFGTQHGDGATTTHQTRVVGGNLKRGAIPEFSQFASATRDLRSEQRRLQKARAVVAQDAGLLLISTEQDAHRAFAGRLILAPIGAERGAPHRNGAEETVLAGATASEEDQAAQLVALSILAAGALLKQLDLTLLAQRLAINQLGNYTPCPEARAGKCLTKQLRLGECM